MSIKKTAIYLRVSTEGVKGGREQTTEMQLLEIKAYLVSKNITDFEIYEDKGYTGTVSNRPALKRLMSDCRNGKVSLVICWKLDRLFRSLKDLMNTLSEFQTLDITFTALKDGIDLSTATGRLMMQILGAFAEFESSVVKERVKSGLANARSKGVVLGRPFKAGHNVIDKLKREGKTVSQIAAHTGLSVTTVYRTINKQATV